MVASDPIPAPTRSATPSTDRPSDDGSLDDGSLHGAGSSSSTEPGGHGPADGVRLERLGRRWLLWSFLLCPCHLPWTLALISALAGGSALGAVVNAHRTWLAGTVIVLYAIGVAIGFRYLRRAKASGACRVSYR